MPYNFFRVCLNRTTRKSSPQRSCTSPNVCVTNIIVPGGTESTPTGTPIRDVVKSMFPGLLLNSNDLTKLPVMKPEGTRRHGETRLQ
jgi:hypothetical protein